MFESCFVFSEWLEERALSQGECEPNGAVDVHISAGRVEEVLPNPEPGISWWEVTPNRMIHTS